MIVKDISYKNALEDIAYDQILLDLAETGLGGETLRFWEAEDFFIVLGRISKLEEDVKLEEVKRDGIEILRRISAGGTVLQGPGCLNFSLILSYEKKPILKDIRKSYEYILSGICRALEKINIEAKFKPISDLTLGGRKFSGNAQARRKKFMLHHGTILYNFPMEMMERYLRLPKNEPLYRNGRRHSDFLTNINSTPDDIKKAIASVFK